MTRKKQKSKGAKDEKSALSSTFYKDTFLMRFNDKRVKVLTESEFN